MDDLLRPRLAVGDGTASTTDLAAIGCDQHDIVRLIRAGLLRRVRHGAFVDAARFDAADEVRRHLLTTRAVLRTLRGYAISDLSAVAWWGLPVLTSDVGPVHVSGIAKGCARRSDTLRMHPPVAPTDVVELHSRPVVVAELAVLQTCRSISPRAGLIAAEAGLRAGTVRRSELVRREGLGVFGASASTVVALADGHSESAGESWCRLVFAGLGLEQPEQQVVIHDERGRFVGRVDFLFRTLGIIVEFDGLAKYAGADGREALVAEKRREDALRRLGYRVVRLTWADLADPARVLRLLGL